MIKFNKITIDDRQWMVPLLKAADLPGCHQNFGSLFTWAKINKTYVAKLNDYLIVKVELQHEQSGYFYPAGSGDVLPIIQAIIEDAAANDSKTTFLGLSPDNVDTLNSLFPDQFTYQEVRGDFDYVYLLEKLVTLQGRKLSSKRNHINALIRDNEWSFEIITRDNIKECKEMSKKWLEEQGEQDNSSLDDEYNATQRFFKYYFDLEMDGGLLRVNGDVVAFTMGEILNSDTYVIHLEKSFKDVRGAYPMINREFASWVKNEYPHIVYMNREEDVDDEGLRRAKLSYLPDKMNEKFKATFI